MARLTFPDEGSRLVYRSAGRNKAMLNAGGGSVEVFTDAAGTTAADIQSTLGAMIAGGQLSVDNHSRIPLFLGPDGVDTVYVSVDGGPVVAVYARMDDRIDALEVGLPAAAGAAQAAAVAAAAAAATTKADAAKTQAITAAAADASAKANAAQAAAATDAAAKVAAQAATDASLFATKAELAATALIVDNGDGTLTLAGPATDNGDGTLTLAA